MHEAGSVKDYPNKEVSLKNLDKSISLIIHSNLRISCGNIINLIP